MRVRVRVEAGAKRETLRLPEESGVFRISVREKPQEGAANARIVSLIARHFGVPEKAVRIVSGHRRPSKTLQIGAID